MVTVVTGLFNIGRDEWDNQYQRTFEQYLDYFSKVLEVKANMVIFTEQEHLALIKDIRGKMRFKTYIIPTSITDLYMFQHLNRILQIQNSPTYAEGHPNPSAPEISKPLYNVVVCNKMDFMSRAVEMVESDYYVWFDAGFSHGKIDFSTIELDMSKFINKPDKMTMISLQSLDAGKDDPRDFFLQYKDVVIGGVFGGTKEVIRRVRDLYYDLIEELFSKEIKDDDQFYNTILAKRHPELFNITIDNWYAENTLFKI